VAGLAGFVRADVAGLAIASAQEEAFLAKYGMAVRNGRVELDGGGGGGGVLGFAGGRITSRDPDFVPSANGFNSLNDTYGDLLLRRCRAMQDDIPYVSGAGDLLVKMIVGHSGIGVVPDTGDDAIDDIIREEWNEFSKAIDSARRESIVDQQQQLVREVFHAGECFVHKTFAAGLPGGFGPGPCVNLVDRERIPLSMSSWGGGGGFGGGAGTLGLGIVPTGQVPKGHVVRQGVELDQDKRPVAFHVLPTSPDDDYLLSPIARLSTAQRVPASELTQVMRPRRVAQLRGIPWCTSVVTTVRDEDSFSESVIYLARLASAIGIFFSGVSTTMPLAPTKKDPVSGVDLLDAYTGQPVRQMRPGSIMRAANDKAKAQVLASNLPPPSMEAAIRVMLKKAAAGMDVPYAHMARDYRDTTYSSARQEENIDRRGYRSWQDRIARMHTVPAYLHWLNWSLAFGSVGERLSSQQRAALLANPRLVRKVKVLYPGYEFVDPNKEANATQVELEIGLTSLSRACGEQGRNWQDVQDERLREEKREQEERTRLGLPPRAMLAAGTQPRQDQAGDESKDRSGDDDEATDGLRRAPPPAQENQDDDEEDA
jgi:lambda family phage portal protein